MLLSMTGQMGMSMKGSGVFSICVVTKAATQMRHKTPLRVHGVSMVQQQHASHQIETVTFVACLMACVHT